MDTPVIFIVNLEAKANAGEGPPWQQSGSEDPGLSWNLCRSHLENHFGTGSWFKTEVWCHLNDLHFSLGMF